MRASRTGGFECTEVPFRCADPALVAAPRLRSFLCARPAFGWGSARNRLASASGEQFYSGPPRGSQMSVVIHGRDPEPDVAGAARRRVDRASLTVVGTVTGVAIAASVVSALGKVVWLGVWHRQFLLDYRNYQAIVATGIWTVALSAVIVFAAGERSVEVRCGGGSPTRDGISAGLIFIGLASKNLVIMAERGEMTFRRWGILAAIWLSMAVVGVLVAAVVRGGLTRSARSPAAD